MQCSANLLFISGALKNCQLPYNSNLSLPLQKSRKMAESKYSRRGVSATKDEVHKAIKKLDKGLYPKAFCKILPDMAAGDPAYCNIMHADTAGTKTSLAYLYWKETRDLSVWKGIVQDAIVMNLDDMGCVGCVDNILLSSTIGRNKNHIPGEVLNAIISGTSEFLDRLRNLGIQVHLTGGETADVGDIVRTADVGYTAFARLAREKLIVNDIKDGAVIVGLASYGKASYEQEYNSGIGSNGLTFARHELFHKDYRERYPESYDPSLDPEVVYTGPYALTDTVEIGGESFKVGKLALSPTRTYLPVIKAVLQEIHSHVQGMIHCTGGGQTKVSKFVEHKKVVKNNFLATPPLYELIQSATDADWKEMYQVFNMGHRLEFYVSESQVSTIMDIASSFNIDAAVVGHVENADENSVVLETPHGRFEY
jgi:phosphoribosylformylglycinamidine cyclo-ligase